MKHLFDALGVFALAGLSMTAQAPTRPLSSELTIVGCLKRWDKDASAPAQEAGKVETIIVSDVQSKTSIPTRKSYAITADATVNLSSHLNHKVELIGNVAGVTAPAVTPPSRPPLIVTPPSEPGDNSLATFHVKSLTMIKDTCP